MPTTSFAYRAEPTVSPTPGFDPKLDADLLHKAMKGFGTDEKTLIKILCRRTGQERLAVGQAYKQAFGNDLSEVLQSECSGKFGDLMVALATPPAFYDADNVRRAIDGIGTDEDSLIEILCPKTNSEILLLKSSYSNFFHRDLEQDIKGDTDGDFKRLLISLLNGQRDESPHVDRNRAAQTAQELYKRGEKLTGTDEAYFNSVLAAESQVQLRAVFEEYQRVSGKDLDVAIKSEMSGDLRTAMVSIVKCIRKPTEFYAEQLYKAMKGAGTNDQKLVRLLVTRSDKDLAAIKREFQQLYNQSLEQCIKSDTSGDYETGLLALCGVAAKQ